MNTPRYDPRSKKCVDNHHGHSVPRPSREDPAIKGVLVFDPLHAFFPVLELPDWMVMVSVPDGKLPLDPWKTKHITVERMAAVQTISRGMDGPVPVAIYSGLPLPEVDAVVLKIVRDPEDVAFCLSKGRDRDPEVIDKISELLSGVRADFASDTDPGESSIIATLRDAFVTGNGCHFRDHRWLASKVLWQQSLKVQAAGNHEGLPV